MEWPNAKGLVTQVDQSDLCKKVLALKKFIENKYGTDFEFLYDTIVIDKPRLDYLAFSASRNPEFKLSKTNAALLNYVAKKSNFIYNTFNDAESPFDSI